MRRRWLRPKYKPRQCDRCQITYFRCNKVRAWPVQAPGRRDGWEPVTLTICTRCMGADLAERLLVAASATPRKVLPPVPRAKEGE